MRPCHSDGDGAWCSHVFIFPDITSYIENVPLFTTPTTVDLSSTEPPTTVGIVIAVVVIFFLIMLVAVVLVAIVAYYQYRKRLVRETFRCVHSLLSTACVNTPDTQSVFSSFFYIVDINLLNVTLTILRMAMMSNCRRVQLMIQCSRVDVLAPVLLSMKMCSCRQCNSHS